MATPLSIAHRGGRGLWSENTLFAFSRAIEAGVDGAELDVQLTRDGALVVMHDFRIGPAIFRKDGEWWRGPELRIRDLTLAELREFDIGKTDPRGKYHAAFPEQIAHDGERVPLLADVLSLIGSRAFRLLVEIKTAWHDRAESAAAEAVADAAIAVLRAHDFTDRATLVSFDWRALTHARAAAPEIRRWHLALPSNHPGWMQQSLWAAGFEPAKFGSLPKAIAAAGGQGWLGFHADATREAIRAAHAEGLSVGVWNVNDAAGIRDFAHRGADAICSDYPDRLLAALGRRDHSPSNSAVER